MFWLEVRKGEVELVETKIVLAFLSQNRKFT